MERIDAKQGRKTKRKMCYECERVCGAFQGGGEGQKGLNSFLGKKQQSLFFRDKQEGVRNWSSYRQEGEVGQGYLYPTLSISQKKEVRSRWQNKIQSSLERNSGRETNHLYMEGMFWVHNFFCPKTKNIKNTGMSNLECTVD